MCAVAVSLAVILGGVYIAAHGNPAWGAAMGGGGLLGGVGLPAIIPQFIGNKSENESQEVEKPPMRPGTKLPERTKRRK
jgi:hypothetical protein